MRISRGEEKVIEWIQKQKDYLFFIVVTALAIVIRYKGRNFMSNDMETFLLPWYDSIKAGGGLKALSQQYGDYNILFQTIIAFMTYSSIDSVILFKLLSIVFEFGLAFACAWFICDASGKEKFKTVFNIIYAVILFLPTVILNGAYWGQCDSIYTCFIVLTLMYLFKEKYVKAFVFLGLAFAFKFQTIFVLPFIVCYYFYKKKFSVSMFGISILVFWATGIFGYFNGRNIFEQFTIYASQTDTYHNMFLNVTSFWQLIGDGYDSFKDVSIMITLILCGIGLYAILANYKKMDTLEEFLNTAAWFVWTCVLFLPAMHERYTYPVDILLILCCFTRTKYIKYATLSCMLSLISYGAYLVGNAGITQFLVVLYVGAWVHFTYTILTKSDGKVLDLE